MASTAFSLEAATKSLHEDGFLDLNELEVGNIVLGMEQKGFQHLSLLSPYGLDYYKQYVVDHPVSNEVLSTDSYLIDFSVSNLYSNPSSIIAASDIG
jgi:hypothetical protein